MDTLMLRTCRSITCKGERCQAQPEEKRAGFCHIHDPAGRNHQQIETLSDPENIEHPQLVCAAHPDNTFIIRVAEECRIHGHALVVYYPQRKSKNWTLSQKATLETGATIRQVPRASMNQVIEAAKKYAARAEAKYLEMEQVNA